MRVLVTGGAGYIGSHACKALASHGHTPITVDNLIYGHEWAVQWGPLYKFDICETEKLIEVFEKEKIEAVMHFAAFAYVGESSKEPLKYYHNNVLGTLSLLSAMKRAGIQKIVFSSTCATYGIPKQVPMAEDTPQNPINPYGQSKLMVETILQDYVKAYGISAIALRYFNAAGADAEMSIGEDHNPESHLIPLTLDAAFGKRRSLTVFGTDYPTADGTCIRDYVHVTDLAEAHVLALQSLNRKTGFEAFNLGTGTGSSVKEIITTIEKVTGKKVPVQFGDRRIGDPPALVASGDKAKKKLGWQTQHSTLENIILTASRWHQKHFGSR